METRACPPNTPLSTARRRRCELFALHGGLVRELRERGVVRTENAPASDYAEYLVACALNGTLAPNSEKSYGVIVSNQGNPSSSSWTTSITESGKQCGFPSKICGRWPRTVQHVNGHIVHAPPTLRASPTGTDITSLLRAVP